MVHNRIHSNYRFGRTLLCLIFAAAVLPSAAWSQSLVSVDQLKQGFDVNYKNEVVIVRGWVSTEKRVESSSFKGFYLRDRFGSLLLVRTTTPLPDITTEIQVTGVALRDADNSDIYLSETKREVTSSENQKALATARSAQAEAEKKRIEAEEARLAAEKEAEKKQMEAEDARRAAEAQAEKNRMETQEKEHYRTILFSVLGGAIVILVILGITLTFRRKTQPKALPAVAPGQPLYQPTSTQASQVAAANVGQAASISPSVDDYRTVKVYKTTKVLPGKLVVVENHQESDTIHLTDQTGHGEIEIGRDSPDISSGIRIKDKSNTLSRRQAKLVYASATRDFKLINLAGESSNPTLINGKQMAENESVALKDGDMVTMGNLELKFRQK
jgi:hypothetical protein